MKKSDTLTMLVLLYFLLSLFIPPYFYTLDLISTFFIYNMYFIILCIFFISIFTIKINGFLFTSIAFQSFIVISTFVNGGDIFIINVLQVVAITLLITIIYELKYSDKLMKIYLGLFGIFIIIELIIRITIPGGIGINSRGNPIYLLGAKNEISFIIVPYLTLLSMFKRLFSKITFVILFLLSVILSIISASNTAIVGVIIFVGMLILMKLFKIKSLNFKYMIIIVIATFVILVLVQQIENFRFIIENVLRSDITLHGRTEIWTQTFKILREQYTNLTRLIFGYGVREIHILTEYTGYRLHSHNEYLEILIYSGLFGTILFWSIMTKVSRRLMANTSYQTDILKIGIFSVLLMSMTDLNFSLEFFMLLSISNGLYISKKGTNSHEVMQIH